MQIVTQKAIQKLAQHKNKPAVSMFMPRAVRGSPNDARDRYVQLLKEARDSLIEWLPNEKINNLLTPGYKLVDRVNHLLLDHSLAIFISEEEQALFPLYQDIDQVVVASDRFHVNPLLQLLSRNYTYYILTLSRGATRLLKSDLQTVELVDLDLPQGVEAVVGARSDEEKFATMSRRTAGNSYYNVVPAMDRQQVDVETYCRAIDERLSKYLNGKRAPVMLAGLSTIQSRFRSVTKYQNVLEEGIKTNPDRLSNERLHQRSISKIEKYAQQQESQVSEQYFQLAATNPDKTSSAVEEIIPAAHQGRIESLLVQPKIHLWGMYDPGLEDVVVHHGFQPGDYDLVDLAAQATFDNGGQVVRLHTPGDGDQAAPIMAAILRW